MSAAATQPKLSVYIMDDGKELGPYGEMEIVTFIQRGSLTGESIVRPADDANWTRLSQVLPALFPAGQLAAAGAPIIAQVATAKKPRMSDNRRDAEVHSMDQARRSNDSPLPDLSGAAALARGKLFKLAGVLMLGTFIFAAAARLFHGEQKAPTPVDSSPSEQPTATTTVGGSPSEQLMEADIAFSLYLPQWRGITLHRFVEVGLGAATKSWKRLADDQWLLSTEYVDQLTDQPHKLVFIFKSETDSSNGRERPFLARIAHDGSEVPPAEFSGIITPIITPILAAQIKASELASQAAQSSAWVGTISGTLAYHGVWGMLEHVSQETGDRSIFLFTTDNTVGNTKVGRKIFDTCREGESCTVKGKFGSADQIRSGFDLPPASNVDEILAVESVSKGAPGQERAENAIAFTCTTPKHTVAVSQEADSSWTYRSWNSPRGAAGKPDLLLRGGTSVTSGECHFNYWTFANAGTTFVVSETPCAVSDAWPDRAIGDLTATKGDNELVHEYCMPN